MAKKKISVCVVGAGPAGLSAARLLAADPESFAFDVFEQNSELGGIWVYTDETGIDKDGYPVHSSMYKGLRTNLPQELMGFPDFPMPMPAPGQPSYPTHVEVLQYLRDYATHFDIHKYIQYCTRVRLVEPLDGAGGDRWRVTLWNLDQKKETTKEYDAVAVCNGITSTPYEPEISGIELFEGETIHSHDYRTPDRFKGKRVAVLGAAFSGKDIAVGVSPVAEVVYLCHALDPLASKFPDNVIERAAIASATEYGFTLTDGSTIDVDILVYSTGYLYNYSFLSPRCGIQVQGRRVRPLYKHMINIERPTLALIGVPYVAIPLSLSHLQLLYFLQTLKDPSKLPSKEEMYADEENEMRIRKEKGFPPRYAHNLDGVRWAYYDFLSTATGGWRQPKYQQELFERNLQRLQEDFGNFRKDRYADIVAELKEKEQQS